MWCPVIAYTFEFGGRRLQAGSMTARISLIQGERAVIDRPYSLRFSLRIPNYETPHQSPGPRATYQSRCRDRFVAKRVFNRPARP